MITIIIRTFIIYTLLVIAMRLMGKRQVGELQISELVSTLLISEIAAAPIAEQAVPITYAIIPILIILSLEVILSFAVTKSNTMKRLLGGRPSILISRGVLNQKELERSRISVEELLSELRQKNVTDICDVYYAILEDNGQLSVIPKVGARSVCVDDLDINLKERGMAHALVIDGHIKDAQLKEAKNSEKWIMQKLSEMNCGLSDVFLFSVDDDGQIDIIKKQGGKT